MVMTGWRVTGIWPWHRRAGSGMVRVFTPLHSTDRSMSTDSRFKPTPAAGCAIIFLILAFIGAVFGDHSSGGGSPTPARAADHCDEGEAFVMSESFVKDRLKSPSTADFPWSSKSDGVRVVKSKDSPCTFIVSSYVDSQNSFGATLRMRYVATLHNVDNTDQWGLDDLQTDQ